MRVYGFYFLESLTSFAAFWFQTFWELAKDASVEVTLAPRSVEVDSVVVVALMRNNTEVLTAPVIVVWYVETSSLGCLFEIFQ